MDQLPTDDMRAHITKMSKRSYYNEEDKSCFQQMLMLLNSLEALSQDQNLVGDDFSSMDYSIVSNLRKSLIARYITFLNEFLGQIKVIAFKDT